MDIKNIIAESGLFDRIYYAKKYKDVRSSTLSSLDHYCIFGIKEDRKPNADFDPVWYREYYQDVKETNILPFIHFITAGKTEGRFQNEAEKNSIDRCKKYEGSIDYLGREIARGWAWCPDYPEHSFFIEAILNNEVIGRGRANIFRKDLFEHNVGTGYYGFEIKFDYILNEGDIPELRLDFSDDLIMKNDNNMPQKDTIEIVHENTKDGVKYCSTDIEIKIYPFINDANLNNDFKRKMIDLGIYDEQYYLQTNDDVKNAGIDPFVHFVQFGLFEKRNPSLNFNVEYYLKNNIDCYFKQLNPIEHFMNYGNKQNILTCQETEIFHDNIEKTAIFCLKDLELNQINMNIIELIRLHISEQYDIKVISEKDGSLLKYFQQYCNVLILNTNDYQISTINSTHQEFIQLFCGYNIKVLYFIDYIDEYIYLALGKQNNLRNICYISNFDQIRVLKKISLSTIHSFVRNKKLISQIENETEIAKSDITLLDFNEFIKNTHLKDITNDILDKLNSLNIKENVEDSWRNNNMLANNKLSQEYSFYNSYEISAIDLFKIKIKHKELISFDIFDTLIERTFLTPHAIFSKIEFELEKKQIAVPNFKNIRIEAELIARKNTDREEVTFNDIYNVLENEFDISSQNIQLLKELEIQEEKKHLKAKEFGMKLFRLALEENKKVILISDMYLDKSFLMEIFLKENIRVSSEDIFVSSEENATKHSGKLFKLLEEKYGFKTDTWLHVGDNLHSDIYMPNYLGIDTFYVKNSSKSFLDNYHTLFKEDSSDKAIELHKSSIFGTIANKLYGSNNSKQKLSFFNADAYRIGFETLGIVFLGFLKYITTILNSSKYNKVFFVSRDGYYLKVAYDLLKEKGFKLPDSYYFFSSRVLSYSASFVDKESIKYVANKDYFPTTLRHLLKTRFNFTDKMFDVTESTLKEYGFSSFDDDVIQHINHKNYVDFVITHSQLIIKENLENKQLFHNYIDDLNINKDSLIVDIGYAGSLQKTILTITGKKVDGLYFIVNEKIKELQKDGLNFYSYLSYDNKYTTRFFKYVQLFELFFSSTHPSVIGLKKDSDIFQPIYDQAAFSEKTNKILAKLHHGAIDFISSYIEYHKDIFEDSEQYSDDIILANIFNFFENPHKADCQLFDEVEFEDNFGANKYTLITKDLEKLQKDDDTLLAHGVWASASRKLLHQNSNKIISSSNFTDKINDVFALKPFFKSKEYSIVKEEKIFPFINIIINMKEEFLGLFIESVKKQHYPYFLVTCYFEEEPSNSVKEQIIYTENITYTTGKFSLPNLTEDEWILFVDNPVLFEPNLLAEMYFHIIQNTNEIIYCDEDDFKDGVYLNPRFKPDFSQELMLSQPYYCGSVLLAKFKHLSMVTNIYHIIPQTIFDAISKKISIGHISKILFHNLLFPKQICYKNLIEDYLKKQQINYTEVYVEEYSYNFDKPVYSIKFPNEGPEIAIIIPTKNMFNVLKVCLDSLELTTYKNYKVYIIDNDSTDDDILEYFKTTSHQVLKISSPNGIFSYSYLNNQAVKMISEEYILFLNNDVKVITPDWLSQMAGLIQIDGIGQVGARLYYENDMLQHVGITNHIAPYGLPAPSFKLIDGDSSGYLNYAKSIKNYSAMTAACMLTKKEVFLSMGGFDDIDFSVAYNDCDYGFKLTQNGFRNVVAPNAELYHYEGVTRGIGIGNDKPSEEAAFIRKYKNWKDPYYNPNLTKSGTDFSIRNTIVRTLPDQKFRCLMISHNYEYEGAPLILFEIAKGLKKNYNLDVVVLSPTDGPLKVAYEENCIEAHVLHEFNLFSSHSISEYEQRLWKIKSQINNIGADVICANTVLTYWGVEVANEFKIPSLWIIHESEPPFEHLRDHSKLIESRGKPCLNYTYKNIFVAHSTKELFEPFNLKNNFEVIHNGFDTSRVTITSDVAIRESMRKELNIEDKFVFICPGVVSKRKSQIDAIKAFELLPDTIKSQVVILIVGDRKSSYSDEMHSYHQNSDEITKQNIKIISETKEISKYYNASDAFLFTSHLESFPKVIQEAMYLQLPIVSTNTFGIKEQVFHNSSALLCDIGDIGSLSQNMKRVFEDESLRKKLVINALSALDKLPTYEEMVKEYNELMQQAFLLK